MTHSFFVSLLTVVRRLFLRRPYWKTCSYCYLKYDLIGHTETFEDDTKQIVEKAGIRESMGQLRDLDMFEDPKPINRFTEISTEQMNKLFEIYKLDFEAFGYDFQAYLKQASDSGGGGGGGGKNGGSNNSNSGGKH